MREPAVTVEAGWELDCASLKLRLDKQQLGRMEVLCEGDLAGGVGVRSCRSRGQQAKTPTCTVRYLSQTKHARL